MSIVLAACGPPRAVEVPIAPRPKKLATPSAVDPGVLGGAYLTTLATHLQPNWAQFLEDCRLRLPITHPLNQAALVATAELVIDRRGGVTVASVSRSGNADFDHAVRGVLGDARRVEVPPLVLVSDDETVHVAWTFARDARQAGPATARVMIQLGPLAPVVATLLSRGELGRAALRIAASEDPDRDAATRSVMLAALGEALDRGAGARTFAIEAIGRARAAAYAPRLRELLSVTTDTELRLAATTALTALADAHAIPQLVELLPNDLRYYPRLALADTAALVALGQRDRAATIIRAALATDKPDASGALPAHSLAPSAQLDAAFTTWFTRGDARTRAGVCAAQASPKAIALIVRGMRDADASVRATCVDAAARLPEAGPVVAHRLRELLRDRDRTVRARALTALGRTVTAEIERAAVDSSPEVRAAAAHAAPLSILRVLVDDPDPEVRAAAVAALGVQLPDATARAASDVAPQVRLAAIHTLADDAYLARLATDDAPDVATAALIHLVARRGRTAVTADLLAKLAAAPAGGAERVRIALAWLLAA